jgi:hypothetical protein
LLVDPDGTQTELTSEPDPTDPLNFTSYEAYRSANAAQPEEAVRDVWYEAHGKKYLIIYDRSEDEFKRQATQAAKDHRTKAYSVEPSKLSELVEKVKPNVIMSFSHGFPNKIYTGEGESLSRPILSRELKEAGQAQDIRFVAQACSAGMSGGLMDKLQADPDLRNYTFVSHTSTDHVTRNSDIRVAGSETLPSFLRKQLRDYYRTSPRAARRVADKVLARRSPKEDSHKSEINTVLREISVLGFDKFWSLLTSSTNVKTDPEVLSLNLSPEALERFSKGIDQFRSRFNKALSKEKTDTSPHKHHVTEIR